MLSVTKEMAVLWLDDTVGLLRPYKEYGLSISVILYTTCLKSIPPGLDGAAIMDGASVWTTVRKVIFPILAPV